MTAEYRLQHAARKKDKKNKGNKGRQGDGVFHAGKGYTNEQKRGDFNFDTVHGMKLTEVEYKIPSMAERKRRRKQFDAARREFVKELAEKHADMLVERLGLTRTDIELMKKGQSPAGFNVHHKLPIHGGGKNEFSNFILTPLYPHDQWHHDIIDPQIDGLAEGRGRKLQFRVP